MTRGRDEGSVYRRKSDGRWVAVLHWPDGKRKYRYARTQREASAQLVELHALRRDGLPAPRDRLTVGKWLDEWMERYVSHLAPQTQHSYGHFTDKYVRPGLGRRRLLTLSVRDVAAWLDDLLEDGASPKTASYSLIILRAALVAAMREDILVRNPAALVKAPKYRPYKGKPLTTGEAQDLIGAIQGNRMHAFIVLALTSGLRRGELLGLTWGAIHEKEGYLHVLQQAQREKGKGILLVPTKTERSEAPVAVTKLFLRALQAHRGRLLEERVKAGPMWKGSDNPVAPDALVFPSRAGTAMEGTNAWREWRDILRSAGIEHRRLHDSRHTTATLLRALGVSQEVVQAILRHAHITTQQAYVHTDLTQQREAAAALDDLLGGVLG